MCGLMRFSMPEDIQGLVDVEAGTGSVENPDCDMIIVD
jgi:hypothetical protein